MSRHLAAKLRCCFSYKPWRCETLLTAAGSRHPRERIEKYINIELSILGQVWWMSSFCRDFSLVERKKAGKILSAHSFERLPVKVLQTVVLLVVNRHWCLFFYIYLAEHLSKPFNIFYRVLWERGRVGNGNRTSALKEKSKKMNPAKFNRRHQ